MKMEQLRCSLYDRRCKCHRSARLTHRPAFGASAQKSCDAAKCCLIQRTSCLQDAQSTRQPYRKNGKSDAVRLQDAGHCVFVPLRCSEDTTTVPQTQALRPRPFCSTMQDTGASCLQGAQSTRNPSDGHGPSSTALLQEAGQGAVHTVDTDATDTRSESFSEGTVVDAGDVGARSRSRAFRSRSRSPFLTCSGCRTAGGSTFWATFRIAQGVSRMSRELEGCRIFSYVNDCGRSVGTSTTYRGLSNWYKDRHYSLIPEWVQSAFQPSSPEQQAAHNLRQFRVGLLHLHLRRPTDGRAEVVAHLRRGAQHLARITGDLDPSSN